VLLLTAAGQIASGDDIRFGPEMDIGSALLKVRYSPEILTMSALGQKATSPPC